MPKIAIYDTSLRDGMQSERVNFSVEDKIKIARKLDEFGVAYIEGGWPGATQIDTEFFRRARDIEFKKCEARGVRQHPQGEICRVRRPADPQAHRVRSSGHHGLRQESGVCTSRMSFASRSNRTWR